MKHPLLAIALSLVTGVTGCALGSDDDANRAAQGASCSAPAYVAGTRYAAGARVTSGGKTFECKPWPYTGWCSIGGAYAPGSGYAWRDAWTEITSCGAAPAPAPTTSPTTPATCSASAWTAGRSYRTGDIVAYGGKYYVATHDNPGYDPTISTWFWSPTTCASAPAPSPSPSPTTGTGLARWLSRTTFEAMFPGRNGFYTYDGLVEATKKFPAFATTGSIEAQKREVAAFLANVAHETGQLVYVEEIAKGEYADYGIGCAPAAGKRYYGRGSIQLSWNYNYCAASASIFGDANVLRNDPDRVARESWLAWATGIWFWMTSTGAGSTTAHTAILERGFGETIRTINGGLECGGRNPAQVNARIEYYKKFCAMLGVDPGASLGC